MFNLNTPLLEIPGIGPRFLTKLKRLNIETVRDLIFHFPSRYEDYSEFYKIGDLEPGQQAVIRGVVEDISLRRSWQRHLAIVEARIADETGVIKAVWFNQPYVKNVLRLGTQANFAGKVSLSDHEIYLSHPSYEVVGDNEEIETKHTGRLVPIYPETRGLTSKGIRFLIQPILKNIATIKEFIPENILAEKKIPEINQAIHSVHYPERIEDALAAKRRFSFEELFLLQLLNMQQKIKLSEKKAPAIGTDLEEMKKILAGLPFPLTTSQKKSLWEILQDLEKPHPMNRLLQGDVGSGKTVVSVLAAISVHKNGYQTAFMAPTEVLATQHFETFKKLFSGIAENEQPVFGLLTGHAARIVYANDLESAVNKKDLEKKVASGEISMIVGTHALIEKKVGFKNLGLVIIDEQHRFGVEQRARLSEKNAAEKLLPHFLSMSATPIPRTLMLTVFGDLDISTITELPTGRKKILTKIVDPANRAKAYAFIRGQIRHGRQAFVICPRIEPAEELRDSAAYFKERALLETKSVKEEFEKLKKKIFPDLRVAMLHGQMKSKEKETVMRDFKNGKCDILVSTSVIEVGVDVPNATIMMIEGSERFGLAQLYQLRGRVGRGEHQSFCFLFTESSSESVAERLKAIVEAKNGFELAELDLRFRGPGEFLGQKQTGLPDIAMSGLQDIELIKESRDAAHKVIAKDPQLRKNSALKQRLMDLQSRIHLE